MPHVIPIDLSQGTLEDFKMQLGELVRLSLLRSGACVIIARGERELTVLSPEVIDHIPPTDMAEALLSSQWSEEEVVSYLSRRGGRK